MVDKSEDKLLARHSLLSAEALAEVDGDGGRNSALIALTAFTGVAFYPGFRLTTPDFAFSFAVASRRVRNDPNFQLEFRVPGFTPTPGHLDT